MVHLALLVQRSTGSARAAFPRDACSALNGTFCRSAGRSRRAPSGESAPPCPRRSCTRRRSCRAVRAVERDRELAPLRRAHYAAAIVQHVAVPVRSQARNHDAALVRAGARRTAGVERDHDPASAPARGRRGAPRCCRASTARPARPRALARQAPVARASCPRIARSPAAGTSGRGCRGCRTSPPGHDGVRIREQVLDELHRPGRGRDHHAGVRPEPEPHHEVRPRLGALAPRRQFVGPCAVVLRTAEHVGLFGSCTSWRSRRWARSARRSLGSHSGRKPGGETASSPPRLRSRCPAGPPSCARPAPAGHGAPPPPRRAPTRRPSGSSPSSAGQDQPHRPRAGRRELLGPGPERPLERERLPFARRERGPDPLSFVGWQRASSEASERRALTGPAPRRPARRPPRRLARRAPAWPQARPRGGVPAPRGSAARASP